MIKNRAFSILLSFCAISAFGMESKYQRGYKNKYQNGRSNKYVYKLVVKSSDTSSVVTAKETFKVTAQSLDSASEETFKVTIKSTKKSPTTSPIKKSSLKRMDDPENTAMLRIHTYELLKQGYADGHIGTARENDLRKRMNEPLFINLMFNHFKQA